jgi:hypothetical protein
MVAVLKDPVRFTDGSTTEHAVPVIALKLLDS